MPLPQAALIFPVQPCRPVCLNCLPAQRFARAFRRILARGRCYRTSDERRVSRTRSLPRAPRRGVALTGFLTPTRVRSQRQKTSIEPGPLQMMVRFNPTSGGTRMAMQSALCGLAFATTLASAPAQAQNLPLIRDTEIENLLNDYARPIFHAAGLGSGRIKVRIVQNDAFNAFVLDGRNVFVHTGTLMQAQTPNEVIGVIAHESGHITGGHMAALRARVAKDQTRALLAQILGIGLMVAGGVAGGGARERSGRCGPRHSLRWQRDRHALAAGRAAPAGIGGRPGGAHLPQRDEAVRPRHARDLRAFRAAGIHLGCPEGRLGPQPSSLHRPSRAPAPTRRVRAPTFRRKTRRNCNCVTT